ncbi:hypothetical protein M433DRAFT_137884 [Acidomyces richmondensis BFW]|nr:MAG: hypothetical protein FE78DRAFT_67765 [Acidomyces sp. 'richmondensis']KYG41650.1 hypothetical protein M433DRAFT_137884 [Acidomyces richmondensis BFW]
MLIQHSDFWKSLNETIRIVTIFNNAIIAAQSSTATMPTVVSRWRQLKSELLVLQDTCSVAPILTIIHGDEAIRSSRKSKTSITGYIERFQRQVIHHHHAAHFLHPQHDESMSDDEQELVFSAFERIAGNVQTSNKTRTMIEQFRLFRRKAEGFSAGNSCWHEAHSMAGFWHHRSIVYPELADYALRLCDTIANTTISERGFSALKRVQTRLRSRLSDDRLDKLIAIHMNAELGEKDGNRMSDPRNRLRLNEIDGIDELEQQQDDGGDDMAAAQEELQALITGVNNVQDGSSDSSNAMLVSRHSYLTLAQLCT